jgi:hypothetical protein
MLLLLSYSWRPLNGMLGVQLTEGSCNCGILSNK